MFKEDTGMVTNQLTDEENRKQLASHYSEKESYTPQTKLELCIYVSCPVPQSSGSK